MDSAYDIIIIGTGAGGGTLAYALRASGARVLLIERGDFLPQEPQNWSPEAVFDQQRYKPKEVWQDAAGRPFHPGVHYYVGGNTKVYGAALPRLRRADFEVIEHEGGSSPAWPIRYEDLEPYYVRAEQVYLVHGVSGDDPTEPPRSGPFPFPPVPHEPYIAELAEQLRAQGLHPSYLPIGIDLRPGGRCIRSKTCDGFPCQLLAKGEADVCCVRPALESPDVELMTRTYARRLLTDPSGRRVTAVEVERDGERFEVHADIVVVACGAANSAALLLRSANSVYPNGLANSSGLVGRHYMVHNNTALMAVHPTRRNPTVFQKTLAVNDFYFRGPDWPYPMGNVQLLGKLQAGMLTANQPLVPRHVLQAVADRSVDWWVMSEDLPDPENRVTLGSDGSIRIHWKPNNLVAHAKLVQAARQMLRRASYPIVLTQRMGIETNSHQCGTLRFGDDPSTSVLEPFCRSHDIPNLYVVDSSFFPSSTAVNPALTIAAQALRVADHLMVLGSSAASMAHPRST
jgi:choline dehydrogenase-like flavoprotein